MTLRDGRVALVAPLHPDDRERYLVGDQPNMSEESLYKRFMTPVARLTESQLRYLLEVDHRDHEALLAVDEDSGEAVGVARFIRLDGPEVAEAAIIVVDSWQGSGLGKAMLRMLAQAALRGRRRRASRRTCSTTTRRCWRCSTRLGRGKP